jgi:hypothetical protein
MEAIASLPFVDHPPKIERQFNHHLKEAFYYA